MLVPLKLLGIQTHEEGWTVNAMLRGWNSYHHLSEITRWDAKM